MSIRKFIAPALALGAVPAFAEGEASTPEGALTTVVNSVQTGLQSMATTVLTAVGAVVVTCLAFWGLRALVRWARSYFGK